MAETYSGAVVRDYSLVNWSAVIAGAVAAAALSFVFLTVGASLGLSLVSPWPGQSYTRTAAAVAAAWALIASIGSLLAGGYIAGRMRPHFETLNSDESEFRDGLHGLLVWATSVALGLVLATAAASVTAHVGSSMTRFYDRTSSTPLVGAVDTMMRPAPGAKPGALVPENELAAQRTLASSLGAEGLTPDDRTYLAQLVTQRTGVPAAEAEARVDKAYANARAALDTARKATVLAGLVTAFGLLASLAAAWYGALQGGHHRDERAPLRMRFRSRVIGVKPTPK